MSIVRNNLLTRLGYVPYCGRDACFSRAGFDGEQFKCRCGWRSNFEPEFIEQYKEAQAKLKADLDATPTTCPPNGVGGPLAGQRQEGVNG